MRDPSPLEVEAMREPKPKRARDRVLASGLTGRQEFARDIAAGQGFSSPGAVGSRYWKENIPRNAEKIVAWADALWDALEES